MNHNILVSYVLATRGTHYKSKLQPPVLTYTWTCIIRSFSLQIKYGGKKKIGSNCTVTWPIVSDFIWNQKCSAHLIFSRKSKSITFHYIHLIIVDKNTYASLLESSAFEIIVNFERFTIYLIILSKVHGWGQLQQMAFNLSYTILLYSIIYLKTYNVSFALIINVYLRLFKMLFTFQEAN